MKEKTHRKESLTTLRSLKSDELVVKVREMSEQLFGLKQKAASGTLEDTANLTRTRKMIARANTLISEKSAQGKQGV